MPCDNCDCEKTNNVSVSTANQGTWLQNNGEDIHVYSNSLCEGGNGSCIGFNSKLLMNGKINGTPLAVVMQDSKVWLQVVSDDNILRKYDVDANKLYSLLQDFLLDVKDMCLVSCPTETINLNK